jgi:predicted ABC-type exoprotein transport system permease subunit
MSQSLRRTFFIHALVVIAVLGITLPFFDGSLLASIIAALYALTALGKLIGAKVSSEAAKLQVRLVSALLLIGGGVIGGRHRSAADTRRHAQTLGL